MKITIKNDILKKCLQAIQSICQKKTVSDVTQLTHIKIENHTMMLEATDLEIFVELQIPIIYIQSNTNNNPVLINAKRWFDIIKDIDEEEITLDIIDNKIIIRSNECEIALNTNEPEYFPINQIKPENILSINNKEIIECITYCMPMSSISLQTPSTASILFEITPSHFKTTSTDGHCLAHICIEKEMPFIEKPIEFLLSKKGAGDIKKIIETLGNDQEEIIIGKSGNQMIISGTYYTITIKTVSDRFPDYKKIISMENKETITCNRQHFIKAARRLALLTDNKFLPAVMEINEKLMTLHIQNSMIGSTTERITIENSIINTQNIEKISLFPPYFLKAAQEINMEESLTIKFSEKQKPVIFHGNHYQKTMLYVIMPMISV